MLLGGQSSNMAVVFDTPAPVRGFKNILGSFPLLDLIIDPEAVIVGRS